MCVCVCVCIHNYYTQYMHYVNLVNNQQHKNFLNIGMSND